MSNIGLENKIPLKQSIPNPHPNHSHKTSNKERDNKKGEVTYLRHTRGEIDEIF